MKCKKMAYPAGSEVSALDAEQRQLLPAASGAAEALQALQHAQRLAVGGEGTRSQRGPRSTPCCPRVPLSQKACDTSG